MVARLPFGFARDHQVAVEGRVLNMGPEASISGLREARRRSQTALRIRKLDQAGFRATLARIYQNGDQEAPEDALEFDLEDQGDAGAQRDLLDDVSDAPVVQLVNKLLRQAVVAGASDLHVEPHETGLRARMRIDGFLQVVMDRDDVPVRRIVSRLKVMAGLDIAETRLPQDGRISLRLGGRVIDTRVSSLPGNYGERVVLRILDRSTGLMPLPDLGLDATQTAQLGRLSQLPNGVILSTGPTGSGKTTTLYSLLNLANQDDRNIVTVEDPIEYDLPGIGQSQINAEIGMSFAAGLRATLRQDPDVILVGEIRDQETASVAAQASLTGHLVFSSLHANSSAGAVVRLRDLGLDDFLIASTLRAVIAQRLVRRLCDCAEKRPISASERKVFTEANIEAPDHLNHAAGCDACAQTGFAGRIGIFEILEVNEPLREALDRGANEQEIRSLGLAPDQNLFGQALRWAASGTTTLPEAMRVVGGGA